MTWEQGPVCQDTLHNSDSIHVANRTRLYLCWCVSLVCWCSAEQGAVANQLLCLVSCK